MRSLSLPTLFLAAVAGCGSPDGGGSRFIAGFNPPAPAGDEIQVVSPAIRNIPPGANVSYCSYLDQRVTADTDVTHYGVYASATSHHAILYLARAPRPVGTHVCNEDDMLNVHYLAGGGADKAATAFSTLPDGLAFRIPAGAQLMIQSHWINATNHAVDGQAAANLRALPPSPTRVPADLFAVANTMFTLPAGKRTTISAACTMKQDMNLFLIAGHEHEHGTHVDVSRIDVAGTANNLYAHDWETEFMLNPPVTFFAKETPLALRTGDQIEIDCSFDATASTSDIVFPNEMCVAWGFYFPGAGEIDCVDGHWPN